MSYELEVLKKKFNAVQKRWVDAEKYFNNPKIPDFKKSPLVQHWYSIADQMDELLKQIGIPESEEVLKIIFEKGF